MPWGQGRGETPEKKALMSMFARGILLENGQGRLRIGHIFVDLGLYGQF